MPRRKRNPRSSAGLVTLVVVALLAFAAGEAWLLLNSDSGRLKLARYFSYGDPAAVTRIVGRQARHGLAALGVPSDSIYDLPPGPPSGAGAGEPGGPAADSVRLVVR